MNDTIAAQATARGSGGIGIIRVSGSAAREVAKAILNVLPKPRIAEYLPFYDADGSTLDQGIALFFPNPHSFTGEDVLELQGHGGAVILDLLLKRILDLPNVRIARPGEFSERAFLNDKLDLAQAEAIADLIEASSARAARSAMNSLQGVFSTKIHQLVDALTLLRVYVEAAIDFPDEEIDFLTDGRIEAQLRACIEQLHAIMQAAHQGSLLREGIRVVIIGRPNAGKSSLLNALAGRDIAIVTDIAGTTRDVLREHINLDGMPLHIIDTAGLREANDEVERIGIARARQEMTQADAILLMVDSAASEAESVDSLLQDLLGDQANALPITIILNKIDLQSTQPYLSEQAGKAVIGLSAKTGEGVALLRTYLKEQVGFTQNGTDGEFLARRRHVYALEQAQASLIAGLDQLTCYQAGELLAEELRLAQSSLGEITGAVTSDDLLGKIFGNFCIGK